MTSSADLLDRSIAQEDVVGRAVILEDPAEDAHSASQIAASQIVVKRAGCADSFDQVEHDLGKLGEHQFIVHGSAVVSSFGRVGLVDERLNGCQRGVVLEPQQAAARAGSGLLDPQLLVGEADRLSAGRAVHLDGDVVEIAGHGAIVPLAARESRS